MLSLFEYRSHVFDCDGVLLDSNGAKGAGFYAAALPYGAAAARALEAFHHRAGGISRRARVEYFFTDILGRGSRFPATHAGADEVDALLARCTEEIQARVMAAPLVPGAREYVEALRTCGHELAVVSGTEQRELERVLEAHGLAALFDADRVHGGPEHKGAILLRAMQAEDWPAPAVYYGDALDDFKSAHGAGMGFVFVAGCSEFTGWRDCFAALPQVPVLRDFENPAIWEAAA